jgi:hypothetical protein
MGGTDWKWWAEGRERTGSAGPPDPGATRLWVPAGPHGDGSKDGPSEATRLVANLMLCKPPDEYSHKIALGLHLQDSLLLNAVIPIS